jgi:hypothetical protein
VAAGPSWSFFFLVYQRFFSLIVIFFFLFMSFVTVDNTDKTILLKKPLRENLMFTA